MDIPAGFWKYICASLGLCFLMQQGPWVSAAEPANCAPAAAPPPAKRRLKIGLALGGGGGRGAAHVGVLKVLEEEKIPVDYIVGTSAGSAVGGLYAAGLSVSQLEKMAYDKSLLKAYNRVPLAVSVMYVPFSEFPRLLGIHHLVGLYKGNAFARYLNSQLPPHRKNIEDTIIPFRAVATDVLAGKSYVMDHGSLATAIQASSAIPWFKKAVPFEGKLLCDGFAAGSNLPVSELRKMGADIVICVSLDGELNPASESVLHHSRSFRHRMVDILLCNLDKPEAEQADVLLRPDLAYTPMLRLSDRDVRQAMSAGEVAARRAIVQLKAVAGLAQKPAVAAEPGASTQ